MSTPIEIYIDADACPVKEEVYRVAGRYRLKVYVVANSFMFQPPGVLAPLIDAGGDLHAKAPDGRDIHEHAKSNSPRARKFLKERMDVAPNAFDALQEYMKELPKLAKTAAFQAAAERLGQIFSRKPAPWRRRKGVVYFHDVSLAKHLARQFGEPEAIGPAAVDQASRLLTRLQDKFLAEGFLLVYTNAIPEEGRSPLILLPTNDKYAALIAVGTNGVNYGHDTEAVIAWLKTMEIENPFRLAGCGHDFLQARFTGPIKDAEALAARMIEFCPDIADQAHAEKNPGDWLTYHGGFNGWHHSQLDQINTKNVGQLKVAWIHQPGRTTRGVQSMPLAVDGVLYYSGSYSKVYALDGATGEVKWAYTPELDEDLVARQTHSPYNRGMRRASRLVRGSRPGQAAAAARSRKRSARAAQCIARS